MKISFNEKFIAWLTLLGGLSISGVAVYYSVAGLVSIFSASVIPIIIMGVTLEISKLITTIWLKQNWSIAPIIIKIYLFLAIIVLMGITSMGIFGYLSKAHLDQAVPSSIIVDKISIIDEKINTQKENINVARKALAQMDSAVDQTIIRSTSEAGTGRAVALRKSQSKERSSIQNEIAKAQSAISELVAERTPLAVEIKKVDAEVGPIKYIAALIYGDDITDNLLEKSVRWVIIMIVFIFDPLAVAMLLASQYSFSYFRTNKNINLPEMSNPIEEKFTFNKDPLYQYSWGETYQDQSHQYNFSANRVHDTITDSVTGMKENIISSPFMTDSIQEISATQPDTTATDQIVNIVKKKIISNPEKEARRKFKEENPLETIHSLERKKQLGLIDTLPWEQNNK